MIETASLARNLTIPRIVNGMWQVSGSHGYVDTDTAVSEMNMYCEAGLTAWDMADIYGPAETIFGRHRMSGSCSGAIGLTKFVPGPGPMTRSIVEYHVEQSMSRMGTDVIDLLQFHWWDYADNRYLDAVDRLAEIADGGGIAHLGLTNFDTARMEEICGRARIVTNQVQYSVLDSRPERLMIPFCERNGIRLLCYGVLLGGFLSERYLGTPEPDRSQLHTASLQKYKRMIDVWGGWPLFQDLLAVLGGIAARHGVSIPNVATRYVLDRPAVGAAIIGTRLGTSEHIRDNLRVFGLRLSRDDLDRILEVTSRANDIFEDVGDCGSEYRRA